jgi:hypothetical protein
MDPLKAVADLTLPALNDNKPSPLTVKRPPLSVQSLPCTVRLARTGADLEKVMAVRARGFARFLGPGAEVTDAFDHQPNCFHLLAEDKEGNPVGTGRLLHRQLGPVELDAYVDLSSGLDLAHCLEGSRFTVPTFAGSALTKLAIWKAAYKLALTRQIACAIIPVRRGARRDYEMLMLEDTGLSFLHPRDALRREHFIMKIDFTTAEERYRSQEHPLYEFFFVQEHTEINVLG